MAHDVGTEDGNQDDQKDSQPKATLHVRVVALGGMFRAMLALEARQIAGYTAILAIGMGLYVSAVLLLFG